jgi:hypothetical protein
VENRWISGALQLTTPECARRTREGQTPLDHLIDHKINGLEFPARLMHGGDEQRRLREHHPAPNAHPFRLFNQAASYPLKISCEFAPILPGAVRVCNAGDDDVVVAGSRRCSDALTKECSNDEASPLEQHLSDARSQLEIFAALAPATFPSSMS